MILEQAIGAGEYSPDEVARFISDWEKKGVYIQVIERNLDGDYRVMITNSPTPMRGISGVFFEAWRRNIDAFRSKVMAELEMDFPDNPALSNLQESGFNPGMWRDNNYQDHSFSQHAREILIENSGLVLEMLSLYGDRISKKHVAEAIVPATLGRLDEHLSAEHLAALSESLKNSGSIVREHLMARILPAVIEAIGPENCTPQVITETSEQVHLLAVSVANAYVSKLAPSKSAQENRDALASPHGLVSSLLGDEIPFDLDAGQRSALYEAKGVVDEIGRHLPFFISSLGKAYDPYYIGSFADKVGSFGKDTPELISHVGSALAGAEGNPISMGEFKACLRHIQRLYDALGPIDFHHMCYWILPRMIRALNSQGSSVSEAVEGLTLQLARIPAEFMNPGQTLNMMLKDLASSFSKDNPITVDDVGAYIDELLLIEKHFEKHSSSVIYHILPAFIRQQPHLSPKLLHDFREALEAALQFPPEDQEKVFFVGPGYHNPLATVFCGVGEPFSKDSFDKYLELIRSSSIPVLEALSYIILPVRWSENLVDNPRKKEEYEFKADDVQKVFELANRISRSVSGVPSRVPIDLIKEIVGDFGVVNDWKTCEEALALARQYADFLESHADEIRRICEKNPEDISDHNRKWDERKMQVKEIIKLYTNSGGRGASLRYFPPDSPTSVHFSGQKKPLE